MKKLRIKINCVIRGKRMKEIVRILRNGKTALREIGVMNKREARA